MKRILAYLLVLALCLSYCPIVPFEANAQAARNEGDLAEYSKIIVEIANAYDRQGGQIPYDQYNARRSIFSSPEDATAQRTIFLDCSSFVNSCYREGFGVNVLPFETHEVSPSTANYDSYAKENPDNADVIGYWVPAEYPTDSDKETLITWIYENLQVGDILTYRHGTASSVRGHTYIYLGNSTFMHCAGAGSYVVNSSNPALSYDSNASETNGTIGTIAADTIFRKTTHSRYLFKATEKDTVFSFSLIRPFARGLTPTQQTRNRMKIAGLSMEKTASVCENAALFTGSQLTYTVSMQNTGSAKLSGVTIQDRLPAGTAFVSADQGVTVSEGAISWTGDVPAGSTVKVNYTVKITEDTAGALIVSDDTYVSGVKLGRIVHTVSGYTEAQQAAVAQTALLYAEKGYSFESSIAMVKAIYAAQGIHLFDCNTAAEALDLLIDTKNLTSHRETSISDLLVPNLYGGQSIKNGWLYHESENDKTRLPKEEHLNPGDIILADWNGGSTVYFYAGNHKLVTVENSTCTTHTIGDNIFVAGENILISLLGYDRYAVLRPSKRDVQPADIVSIAITQQPNKVQYDKNERFDRTGMVVTATLSDQTQMVIPSYAITPAVLTPDVSFVTVAVGDKTATVNVSVSEREYAYSVSQVSQFAPGENVMATGIVIGVNNEGMSNDKELLIKDLKTDAVIGVRGLKGTFSDFYGFKKGDILRFRATVNLDSSTSTCYTSKKYLAFSSENGTQASTVESSGNPITYTFRDAVEIRTQQDLETFFVRATNKPYTYLKITGGFYLHMYPGKDDTYYRLHKNPEAAEGTNITYDGRYPCFRTDNMTVNMGQDWLTLLPHEVQTEYPGAFLEQDMYVLYTGGNGSYYQLLILDESWTDPELWTPESVVGDVNEDSLVNVDDAIYLLQHVLMPGQFSVAQPADFDGSGAVSIDDAIYLLQHVLMPNTFPLK